MKVIWVSANRFGYELLKEVIALRGINIQAIITLAPTSPIKMHDHVTNPSFPQLQYIKPWGRFKIPVIEVERIHDSVDHLKRLKPDIMFVAGWREKIDKEILDIPKKGTVGFHPTLLPYGRGPAPIINSILNGIKKSGVTMFYFSEGIDEGDIIGQEEFQIESGDYVLDVYRKVIRAGKELMYKFVPKLIAGTAPRIKQSGDVVIFPKLPSDFNIINLNDNIELTARKIRALSHPYSGAYLEIGDKRLIIWSAEVQ